MHRVLFAIVAAIVGVMIANSAVGQVGQFRTVALSDTPAPGIASGVDYDSFSPSLFKLSVNDAGEVAYVGALSGIGVDATNDQALFSEGGGSGAVPLARRGEQTAGLPTGLVFGDQISEPTGTVEVLLNNAGQTAGRLDIEGGAATINRAVFSDAAGGGLFKLARSRGTIDGSETIPSSDLPRYVDIGRLQFNDAGRTAFWASINGTGINGSNNQIIQSESGGSGLEPVVQSGVPAPGAPDAHFAGFGSVISLNNVGDLAFLANLTGSGVTPSTDWAIYSASGPDLSLIARAGDQAADLPTGVVYGRATPSLISIHLNDSNQLSFSSRLEGTGVLPANDEAIFRATGGAIELIVRERSEVGGLLSGVFYDSLGIVQMNHSGDVAFNTFLRGMNVNADNHQAIFRTASGGPPMVVARTGDQAPGLADGIVYSQFTGGHHINDAGQVAFPAVLTNGSALFNGLFVTDPQGELRLLTAVGELFDVSDNPLLPDLRIVSALNAFDLSNGHVAFWAHFTDGSSGVFVTVVPEPGSGVLLLLGGSLASSVRRPRYYW
ncbi:DUF7453 family protein [Bythopirellula goksoeyrii]|uniref:PEP-CTERM protein-sorting domain-containing protein n=1 Tax=Bythopirellula goksoeyrii TaxID=1400387 RepID=A0A5B9Q7B7_9BACT|nr:choice-of-anchor tandem repeat NxxGxxAF-containing protein [Bythopirellula goksoeyrii]QEG34877.1 hypothetical protein Pr1d_21650 [Bythopirellula goksoeyrii]